IETMPSDLPKSPHVHKNSAALPRSCVLSGSSFQTEDKIEKENAEENVDNEEVSGKKILNRVSTSCISVEDVQASLSCLPLPVSICGSLTVTEEKMNPLPQNEVTEVISDILTVHGGMSKTDPFDKESHKKTDLHEHDRYLPKISQSFVEKSVGEQKHDTENIIDYGDSQQIERLASTFPFLEYEAEPYGAEFYYDENISPDVDEFTVEDNIIKSDTLISDAELDDFLYGQSLQPSVQQSLEGDSTLLEPDANEANSTNVKKMDFTEANEEATPGITVNLKSSVTDYKLEPAMEESQSCVQDAIESDSEASVSAVYTEGTRPEQLLDLSQRVNVPEGENREASLVTPKATNSGTGVSFEPAHSGEGSCEDGENKTSTRGESLKKPLLLGQKQPSWVPDSEAPNCMNCQVKFTFTKRRHHCRACGKVFCGSCCNRKCKLQYMEKEARVCIGCYDSIIKGKRLNAHFK
ncbi:ZFY16 protein, partial [Crypturellus undulatus]|nr:ZFY16 protein [Crypturellus undulatus]